jgi:hypothetical protein
MVLSQLGAPKESGTKGDAKDGAKNSSGSQFNTVRPSLPSLGAA